ncbi:MAG: FtsX-like permease family protein [Chloroflexi bacterium]|nr:FtsX-like permease family protein [Chloroflexota bacterium]
MHWTLLKTGLRDAMRRPWLTGLMLFSVALGVAVVVAIDLANDSAARAFHLSTEAVIGRATHVIQGGPGGIDDDVYRRLRVDGGYRLSAPVVEGYAGVEEMGGQTVRVLGVDPLAEAPFRSYLTLPRTPASDGGNFDALTAFYTRPGGVLVGAESAARFGLRIGDRISLRVDSARKTAVIVGLLKAPNDVSARALEGLMLADVSTAQEFFGMRGRLSRIDLIATPEIAGQIAARLPPGLALAPASEQSDTVTQLTAAFQLNLTAFSLLALMVGMFLIYNTVMFTVVQRRQMLGILRCLGVTGRQIFALIMAEAAIIGTVGSVLGVLLGIVLGRFTVALVTQTINDLYFSVTVRGVDVQAATLLKGAVLGIMAALIAAAVPSAEAAAVPAITALQRSDLEDRVRRMLPALTRTGVVMAVAGLALIIFVQSSVFVSFAGLFVFLFGLVFCVPQLTVYLMRVAAWLLGRWGMLGRMAARTVTNALSRTSIAIAALMVAISVTIGVTVMIASFRTTVENWLDQTLLADIYIAPPQSSANRAVSMDPALPDRIAAVPGISGIEIYRNVSVASPSHGPVRLNAVTSRRGRGASVYRFRNGSPDEIWAQVLSGALIITEPFANRLRLNLGDHLSLLTDQGPHDFLVAAVSYDYSSDQGSVLMSLDTYRRYWNDSAISSVAAYVAPGADAGRVEDAVRAALGGAVVRVQANRALRQTALVIFDRTFAITAALRIVAVVVAFIGVLSALMALQLERTRELGTLRATGMTIPQLWRLTLLETGLMGATAGLLSMPVGLAMSLVLIYVINLRSFGWTIFFSPVPEVYVQALAISIAAALLAAVYPMQRMSRMQAATALRSE